MTSMFKTFKYLADGHTELIDYKPSMMIYRALGKILAMAQVARGTVIRQKSAPATTFLSKSRFQ
jgi:hypothetical protein